MRHSIPTTALAAVLLGRLAYGLSPTFLPCQLQESASVSPLLGCPLGTIFVSPNDSRAQFTKVQDAVLSLPHVGSAVILIGEGEYHETVNVTRQGPLTFLGQLSPHSAFDPAGNASTRNLVKIWDSKFVLDGQDDAQSSTLIVAPSFNASLIGAGPTGAPLQPLFGNVDFKAYNIDFQNRAVWTNLDVRYSPADSWYFIEQRQTSQSLRLWSQIFRMRTPLSMGALSKVSRTLGTRVVTLAPM